MEESDGDFSSYEFVRPLKPGSEFLCAICLDVQREPRLLPCAHSFCHDCLEQQQPGSGGVRACAFCRTPYDISQVNRNRALVSLFKELEVYCVAKDQGCAWKDDFAALKKHEQDDCLFSVVECRACNQEILRGQQSDHQLKQCPKRRMRMSYRRCFQPEAHEEQGYFIDTRLTLSTEFVTRHLPSLLSELQKHQDGTLYWISCSICCFQFTAKDLSGHSHSSSGATSTPSVHEQDTGEPKWESNHAKRPNELTPASSFSFVSGPSVHAGGLGALRRGALDSVQASNRFDFTCPPLPSADVPPLAQPSRNLSWIPDIDNVAEAERLQASVRRFFQSTGPVRSTARSAGTRGDSRSSEPLPSRVHFLLFLLWLLVAVTWSPHGLFLLMVCLLLRATYVLAQIL